MTTHNRAVVTGLALRLHAGKVVSRFEHAAVAGRIGIIERIGGGIVGVDGDGVLRPPVVHEGDERPVGAAADRQSCGLRHVGRRQHIFFDIVALDLAVLLRSQLVIEQDRAALSPDRVDQALRLLPQPVDDIAGHRRGPPGLERGQHIGEGALIGRRLLRVLRHRGHRNDARAGKCSCQADGQRRTLVRRTDLGLQGPINGGRPPARRELRPLRRDLPPSPLLQVGIDVVAIGAERIVGGLAPHRLGERDVIQHDPALVDREQRRVRPQHLDVAAVEFQTDDLGVDPGLDGDPGSFLGDRQLLPARRDRTRLGGCAGRRNHGRGENEHGTRQRSGHQFLLRLARWRSCMPRNRGTKRSSVNPLAGISSPSAVRKLKLMLVVELRSVLIRRSSASASPGLI